MLPRLCLSLVVGALATLVAATLLPAAAQDQTGAQIRAAFIYNFARFVEWPADSLQGSGGNLRICYHADDPLAEALLGIAGKKVDDKLIEVVALAAPDAAGLCHIMLLAPAEVAQQLPAAHGVLQVGEVGEIGEAGVAIGLVQVGRQVRFQIDAGRVEAAGLRVSSKLMRLAVKVLQ